MQQFVLRRGGIPCSYQDYEVNSGNTAFLVIYQECAHGFDWPMQCVPV